MSFFRILILAVALASLSGCLLPSPPRLKLFDRQQYVADDLLHADFSGREKGRNAVFLAADTFIQNEFSDFLSSAYGDRPPRIEDIVWWRFAPHFADMYDEVLVIPWNRAKHKNLVYALKTMQEKGEPFDVFILSHGLPGRLSDGDKGYFLSWRELADLKGQLSHLNLVFMQSCWGSQLAEDWFKVGASSVISYPGLNRNFFYIDTFIQKYKQMPYNPEKAYFQAVYGFKYFVQQDLVYSKLLEYSQVSLDEYMEVSPFPEYRDYWNQEPRVLPEAYQIEGELEVE